MALADAIAEQVKKPGSKCAIGKAIATMPIEDIEALMAAFASPLIASAAIWRALKAEGHVYVGRDAVERHRAEDCACGAR